MLSSGYLLPKSSESACAVAAIRHFTIIIRIEFDSRLIAEFLSKPNLNILHAGLQRIAKAPGLEDQTKEELAQFLNDLCPCGLKSHKDAVRKLLQRSARIRRAAV